MDGLIDERPKTWHYGLIARWWAEFNTATPEELAYYRSAIETYGQPVLDLSCGAGRLLIPLAAEGLDVDCPDESGPDDRGTDVGESDHQAPDCTREPLGALR